MARIFKFLAPVILLFSSPISAEYRIGVILPLTGDNASIGHFLKNGIDLARATLPKDEREKIKLYYEDDQLHGNKAVAAYHKLVSNENADAFIVLGSGTGNVIAPLAERDRKIMIAVGASDATIVKGRNYSFIHWVAPEAEMRIVAEEMQRRGYTRIAFITTEQQGALAAKEAAEQAFEKMEMKDRVVMNEVVGPGVRDFRALVAKARAKGVDAFLVMLFPGSLSSFAKETRRQKLAADLAGAEFFEDADEVRASEGALTGQWYVNADESTGEFAALYAKTYKSHPGWGAANAYDVMKLFAQAVMRNGNDNGKIAGFLKTMKDYSGASGKYSATGDNRFDLPVAVKVVREGGFEKIR